MFVFIRRADRWKKPFSAENCPTTCSHLISEIERMRMLFSLFRMRSGRSGLMTSGVRECDGRGGAPTRAGRRRGEVRRRLGIESEVGADGSAVRCGWLCGGGEDGGDPVTTSGQQGGAMTRSERSCGRRLRFSRSG